ncbi:MAG: T9SS type A sorting domain-containing protein, partial [Bacteroidetes bacterium]|nr:T9SS type A sorting domain-containing protein [Bacteroidota bacterium]
LKWWITNRIAWMDANMPGTCTSGITNNNMLEGAITIFPNPVNDNINISLAFDREENVTIELVDVLGRTLLSLPPESYSSGYHQLTIPVTDYAPGIYYLRLNSQNSYVTKKIVVN